MIHGRMLPGEDLILEGIEQLRRGEVTTASLLVSIGAGRIRAAGLNVPPDLPDAGHRLYTMLRDAFGDDAHSKYNGLLRRLVSFEQALECAT